uniref:Uncharacterized protein n=1 Tax=Calidris pygmaea TaxID=425635 RepID=A0A8C3JNB1_9CHAR
MAEDHGLADGDAAVDVAEGPVLLLPAAADEEVLPDVAEGELFLPQLYHDGVGDYLHSKGPHGFLEGGGEQQHLAECSPLDANALAGEALCVDHDVGFIQHEHGDLLHVDGSPFETPVQRGPRRPDDDLLLPDAALRNYFPRTFRFPRIALDRPRPQVGGSQR